jgi:hypothetical protein
VKHFRPDWDEQTVACKTLQAELDYKIDRYLQLKDKKGESDNYVVLLKEEIKFWQILLGEKDGV